MTRRSLPLLLILSFVCSPAYPEETDLSGCWVGSIVLESGESSRIFLSIEPSEEETLRGALSIPDMHSRWLPLGDVENGVELKIGPLALEREDDRLIMALPASIDPGDDLVARFRKSVWRDNDCSSRNAELSEQWRVDLEEGVWSAPVRDRSLVIAATLGGRVFGVEAETGAIAWTRDLGGSVRTDLLVWRGRLVIVSDDGMLTLLDPESGDVARAVRVASDPEMSFLEAPGKSYHYRGIQVHPHGDDLLVGTLDGRLLRLVSGQTIELIVELDSPITAISSESSSIYVATLDGDVHEIGEGGESEWVFRARGPIHGGMTVARGNLLVGDRGYYLHALDPESGSLSWSRKVFFSWIESTPVVENDRVITGTSDAQLVRAFDLATGATLWSVGTGGWAWATPALTDDGRTVVQGVAGVAGYSSPLQPAILLIDSLTGDLVSRLDLKLDESAISGVVVQPLVDPEGGIFAGLAGGELVALRID